MASKLQHRRSGRIAIEIAIVLDGSDMGDKVFSEYTRTVVINRHGAGLVSRHRLAPESKLTVRRSDTNLQTEVRVVGLIESQSGAYTYGVAFLDPDFNFWGMDFPPDTDSGYQARHDLFECGRCKGRERIALDEMQSDIYAVHQVLARSCKRCGVPTVWKRIGDSDSKLTSSPPSGVSALTNLP
jgi:hypothetical protein